MVALVPALAAGQEDEDVGPAECRLFGRVLEADTGAPVSGASVWLERADGQGDGLLQGARTTGGDGAFLFEFLPCRAYVVRTEMIGFDDASEALGLEGGAGAYELTVRLTRAPIELETLTVEVARSTRLLETGFYARKAWVESTGQDFADFYDPVEIEGRSQALHTLPALVGGSRMRFIYRMHSPLCRYPSYYIDGRRYRERANFMEFLDMRIRPKDVEGIEIYRPMSTAIPVEFRDENSTACGAVLIWTKEGRGAP